MQIVVLSQSSRRYYRCSGGGAAAIVAAASSWALSFPGYDRRAKSAMTDADHDDAEKQRERRWEEEEGARWSDTVSRHFLLDTQTDAIGE